jgi:Meiotically up-regulated gene 113
MNNSFVATKKPLSQKVSITRNGGEIDQLYATKPDEPRIDANPVADALETFGQVYIVVCANSELYKIGYTRQPIDKLRADLQRGNPFPLRVIASFITLDPTGDETELHRRYASKCSPISGNKEWFALSIDDIKDLVIEFRDRNNAFRIQMTERLK